MFRIVILFFSIAWSSMAGQDLAGSVYDMKNDAWEHYPGGLAVHKNGNLNLIIKDHLTNTCAVVVADNSCSGSAYEAQYDYYPYGKVLRKVETPRSRFQSTDHETDIETGYNNRNARWYDDESFSFLIVDPMVARIPEWSPYTYCFSNPISFIDLSGATPGYPMAGYYAASVNSRMAAFTTRHPIASASIGLPTSGSTNISTNSVRFSTRIGLSENARHEGSQVNAFRHALWQAEITQSSGISIAKQVGNLHEENAFAIMGENLRTNFTTLSSADQTVDLLNNQIGRKIGSDNPNASMKNLALLTLE